MASISPVSRGQTLRLVIEKIAPGGHGLAKIDTSDGNFPIFVPGAIPGQEVEVVIVKQRGNSAEARVVKVLKKSMDEVAPKCPHFWDCGGCVWQNLPYQKQILYKEDIVRETLEHLTPVDEKVRSNLQGRVLSIIPSPQVFHYRNKLELSFGFENMRYEDNENGKRIYFDEGPTVGFHRPGQWATVLPIGECHLYDEQISVLLQNVRDFMEETRLPVYNPKTHKGMMRGLLLRRGVHTEEYMVCFIVQAKKRELEPIFQHFMRFAQDPRVKALSVVEHFGLNDKPDSPKMHNLKGEGTIRERVFDLEFELSPFSFFQTNTLAAEKLFASIAEIADLSGRETVLDCYCGLGAIGQYLARYCDKVVGVESSSSAIDDALRSAGKNKIGNISFYKGAAEKVLRQKLSAGGKYKFDTVIVDPPRAGLHKDVIQSILEHGPQKIVYVSCNTATFARDLGVFLEKGYELRLVQPVDLFPHTAHVETVALLQKE